MTDLEIKLINICIGELESTLVSMPPEDADNKVREVKILLKHIVDSNEAEL